MILDPTDQFLAQITANCDITDKVILEVGCGRGRITRDLARHARKVVAIDPDQGALHAARGQIAAGNVEFVCRGGEALTFPAGSFDLVVYSLSRHHLPVESMLHSLEQAARLLASGGRIVVIEPGREGTLVEAEERFGVGCGNERLNKAAARKAVESVALSSSPAPIRFRTLFHFADREDFLSNLLSGYPAKPATRLEEITTFLERHTDDGKIVLWAERMMFILGKAGEKHVRQKQL